MIKKLIDEIRKKGNYSFENIIENYELSDEDYFEFLKFLCWRKRNYKNLFWRIKRKIWKYWNRTRVNR